MESLVKDCLKAAIPDQDTEANMHEFNDTVALAEKLVENLKLYGIVGKSEMPLRQYAENLDCLFADKKCSHTLMRARQLIQMELHNSVLLEPLGKAEGIKTLQEALSNTPVSTEARILLHF